jgi:alkylation response protein AidB-like acyl-CoA dehydrogenase
VALSVAAHNGLSVAHLLLAGSEPQKQRYLPPLARGDHLGAWALTEAGSGSDAAAMRTTARRDGQQWILNGSKQFITHGAIGGTVVAMAVTDRRLGRKGISAFVIERGTAGMRAGKKENKLGMRASDTSELVFEECRIPAESLIGVEGEGFIQTMQVLDAGRIGIAALAVGLAQGAYDAARSYALNRRQFGQPIAYFQAIRWKLANMATSIEAARLLTYRAAWLRDRRAERTAAASSMAKLYASEIAVRCAEEGVQIHGGYGFIKDYAAEKYFRDVKLCTIGEGTSEIQRLVIARELLGR